MDYIRSEEHNGAVFRHRISMTYRESRLSTHGALAAAAPGRRLQCARAWIREGIHKCGCRKDFTVQNERQMHIWTQLQMILHHFSQITDHGIIWNFY